MRSQKRNLVILLASHPQQQEREKGDDAFRLIHHHFTLRARVGPRGVSLVNLIDEAHIEERKRLRIAKATHVPPPITPHRAPTPSGTPPEPPLPTRRTVRDMGHRRDCKPRDFSVQAPRSPTGGAGVQVPPPRPRRGHGRARFADLLISAAHAADTAPQWTFARCGDNAVISPRRRWATFTF